MALEIFVGRTALPTAGSGTADFTSADSSTTPVGALHNASRAPTSDAIAGDFVFNIGMSDGTLSRAMSTTANDSFATDDATKGYYDGVVGQTVPGSQTEEGLCTHNSFIAGGQRVNDVNGFFNAALCSHMFFSGCNFTTKEVTLNATVDTVVNVDPGHAWDVVLVTQCQETVLGDEDADNNGSFGFMVKADDAQGCIVTGTNNGDASPGGPSLRISTTYAGMVVTPGTGAIVFGIDVEEGSGTSCDIYPRIAGGQSVLVALTFIGFTDSSAAKIVSWDTPTATGNNAVTGAGGEPIALIHLISRAAAYDTAEADAEAGTMGVSFITPDSQFCASATNEYATGGNSVCSNLSVDQSVRVLRDDKNTAATNSYGSDYVSMDSDGWTENWTEVEDGGAGKCITLAFTAPSNTVAPLAVYHYQNME